MVLVAENQTPRSKVFIHGKGMRGEHGGSHGYVPQAERGAMWMKVWGERGTEVSMCPGRDGEAESAGAAPV